MPKPRFWVATLRRVAVPFETDADTLTQDHIDAITAEAKRLGATAEHTLTSWVLERAEDLLARRLAQ